MKYFVRTSLLLFLFLGFAVAAKAVTAGFKVDNSAGCGPLVVHFTNTSTGATSYSWNLGNGTTSSLKDVSGTYLTPGTYTATLVATGGGTSATYTMTITVYPAPLVSFHASDTSVCPGTTVSFTSTTSGGTPGPMTYIWNFGDGTLSTLATPTHAYSTPGYYRVTLSVTNSMGCVSTLSIPTYMHVFTPPSAKFTTATTHFCNPPGAAVFTNTSSGIPALSYAWQFGDGGTSTATSPTHSYSGAGSYNVKLVVTDGNGCTDSTVKTGGIIVGHITASFTLPTSVCVSSAAIFTNTSAPKPYVSTKWDFGDGGTSTTDPGVHAYTAAGIYTVTLIVFDGYCYDTVAHTIKINALPVSSFTQSTPQPCPPPTSIKFTGAVPPGTAVTWDFGDGGTGSGTPVTHVFTKGGVDTIKMTVFDPVTGCTNNISVIDTFYDMIFDIIDSPANGCTPLPVKFSVSAWTRQPSLPLHPYPYPFTSYTWNFGDGSPTSALPKPVHTYTAPGTYKAFVTVMTSNGCIFSDTVTILVGNPPVITAIATPTHVCYGKNVHIPTTIVSGPVDDYFWSFSNGIGTFTNSSGVLDIIFPVPGTFTCTVYATYHGCPGPPYVIPVSIIVDSPKAIINYKASCSPRDVVSFFDKSLGDDTHLWLFGDGTTSTIKNPVHTYPALGVYVVTLATYNATSGCRDTAKVTIDLRVPVFDFTADRLALCRDDTVTITPKIISGTADNFDWYLNGIITTIGEDPITHVLKTSLHATGFYTVQLVISDQIGCLDTLTKTNYLMVAKPVAHITAVPSTGCNPLPVTFTDASTDITGTTFTNFYWLFGDGGTASVTTITTTHTYTTGGTFSVNEIVTDNIGCKDTVYIPIIVYKANPSFYASNLNPCANDSIHFTNTTTGITGATWDFGDGITSTKISPWHTYRSAGTYTVKIAVTDIHGCTDTITSVNYIHANKPVASFNMSDSFSICPPIMVTFTNTSGSGAISYNWYFGDGGISTMFSPSNLYTKTGRDTVLLIATDANGCKDTMTRYMELFGYAGAFSYAPLTGCAPHLVHFKSMLSNVPNIIFDFADGIVSTKSSIDSIDHIYLNPGAYVPKLILSDNSGCENSSMGIDTIKVDAVFMGFTTEPSPACENVQLNLKDTSFSYFSKINSWFWTLSDGSTSTLEHPTIRYSKAGTYNISLKASDGWGCSDSGMRSIIVYPPPIITTSPDTVVCVTDSATLRGFGGVSYTWAAPATLSCTACNPTFANPLTATVYKVTGTDLHGCKNTNEVRVSLKTKTVSTGHGDTTICFGAIVQLWDSGATKFKWLPPAGLNDPTSGMPLASPDITTNYMIIAQIGSCIPDTNFIQVIVNPEPQVDAGPDQTIVAGASADIRASGSNIYKVSWSSDSTLSCKNCMTPKATPFQTTVYVIDVTSIAGCPNSDTVVINVYCDKSQIFLPNTFTPNGDGQNDVFYPRGRGISIVKSFRIYNRWGQLLFERNNIQLNDAANAWDGYYNGDYARPDVYVYVIDAVCNAGDNVNLKGDVTIIR